MDKIERLRKQKAGLQVQWEQVQEKLERLNTTSNIENDPSTLFKLKHQIQETETKLETLEKQLEDLEAQIQDLIAAQKPDTLKPLSGKVHIEVSQTSEIEKEIFISYAWGGDSEVYVNRLDQVLQSKGITIIRDKRDLGYKGLIKAFMERIGRGKCVITVISDKYLKSPNCMFELVQIAKNGEFYHRIFPIVLSDAQIYQPIERIKYIKHWEDKIKELDEAMRGVSAANLQGFREEIDQYTEIRHTIAELTNLLKDMNTLTPDIHSESEFEELVQAIAQRLDE